MLLLVVLIVFRAFPLMFFVIRFLCYDFLFFDVVLHISVFGIAIAGFGRTRNENLRILAHT